MSRGKKVAIVLCASAIVFAVMLWRDLKLPDLFPKKEDIPEISIERFRFVRDFGGRKWSVRGDRAERSKEEVRITSVDLDISGEAQSALISADSGIMTDERFMHIYNVKGLVTTNDRRADVDAMEAEYNIAEGSWTFASGAQIFIGPSSVSGDKLDIDVDGVFHFAGNVIVIWAEGFN